MQFRSSDHLDASHIGRRVTVRRRLPDGMASDTIGILESFDDASLTVRDRNGVPVRIERALIVAARLVRTTAPPRRKPM